MRQIFFFQINLLGILYPNLFKVSLWISIHDFIYLRSLIIFSTGGSWRSQTLLAKTPHTFSIGFVSILAMVVILLRNLEPLLRWKISISITKNYNSPCNVRYSIYDQNFAQHVRTRSVVSRKYRRNNTENVFESLIYIAMLYFILHRA